MTKKKKTAGGRKASGPASKSVSARSLMAVAAEAGGNVKGRITALAQSPLAVCGSDKNLATMLTILQNRAEPIEVRLTALQSIQAASFSVVAFESCRGDYIAALRSVADDPDPEMRQRVLGILAREKDGFAQKKLLEGLENPEKALVSPEKALQLLGYDIHAEAYPVARSIVQNAPNSEARREALRLLSGDAASTPLFEKILLDKKEPSDVRQVSAAALQSLQPARLEKHARAMLLDKSEHADMQSMVLTALTQFAGDAAGSDKAVIKRVRKLSDKASDTVKQSARLFLSKYDSGDEDK